MQHIWVSWDIKLHLNQTVLIFWTKIFIKNLFLLKLWPHLRIQHVGISLGTNFHLKRSFGFLNQICQKMVIPFQNKANEDHHRILHFWISLSTKFHLKQTILIFFGSNLIEMGTHHLKQGKWTLPPNSTYWN